MPHAKRALPLCATVSLALLVVVGCGRRLEPVTSAKGAEASEALPKGTVVVDVTKPAELVSPFVLREDASAVAGAALVIDEGAESEGHSGRAAFAFDAPSAGAYCAWAYVRWNDSCGNSFSLQALGAGRPCIAQDAQYGSWHWVRVGDLDLPAGEQLIQLSEREDGIAIAQILLTPDKAFVPLRAIRKDGKTGLRTFSDDFARSPGHGMGAWRPVSGAWQIAFSLDPNRIANQYALTGETKDQASDAAVILADGPVWSGFRLAFSVRPTGKGPFGVVLRRDDKDPKQDIRIILDAAGPLESARPMVRVRVADETSGLPAPADVRVGEWHRVEVERWASWVRVTVDGLPAVAGRRLPDGPASVGFFTEGAKVVFDDVAVEEIHWQQEDGRAHSLPWRALEGARWFRPADPADPDALVGRNGHLRLEPPPGMVVREVLLEESPDADRRCDVEGLTMKPAGMAKGCWIGRAPIGLKRLNLRAAGGPAGETRLRRLAVRYAPRDRPEDAANVYRIGPYHFTRDEIPDPSDYLDFTPEEYQRIKTSPDADKLLRQAKFNPLVGRGNSPWKPGGRGAWHVAGGALWSSRRRAALRHEQPIAGDFTVRMKLKLRDPNTVAAIRFYELPAPGIRVVFSSAQADAAPEKPNTMTVHVPADDQWHEVVVSVEGDDVRVSGAAEKRMRIERGVGDRFFLEVPSGRAAFDDIEFLLERRGDGRRLYVFDRRETDWWRGGPEWVDHAGISCDLASTWVSLIVPDARGMLWNKRRFKPDLMLAFGIQENTEWYGWRREPGHTHFAFDNIVAALATETDAAKGYRLEVNAGSPRRTTLYRNGAVVAGKRQDAWDFPIEHLGGHAPYSPRTNRIALVKRGGRISGVVNGREVLHYDDPEPIAVSRAGVGGYRTRVNFTHIEVVEFPTEAAAPEREAPVTAQAPRGPR